MRVTFLDGASAKKFLLRLTDRLFNCKECMRNWSDQGLGLNSPFTAFSARAILASVFCPKGTRPRHVALAKWALSISKAVYD
jgi:hypothetical protein